MTVPELPPGHIIGGKYTLQGLLHRAPWAITHRAITSPNREVVLKVLAVELAARPGLLEQARRAGALTEAVPSHLALRVLDQGIDASTGAPYLVAPHAATPSLAQLVELCPLTPAEAVAFARNLGKALDAAHAAGFPHLALKPSNVFVGPGPGYAVQVGDYGSNLIRTLAGDDVMSFTAPWLAPEQLAGDRTAGPGADIFAAALITFFALTGRSMWQACSGNQANVAAWRDEIRHRPRPASERASELGLTLNPALDGAIARALSRPDERFKTVGEFAESLAAGLEGRATRPLESIPTLSYVELGTLRPPADLSSVPPPAAAASLTVPTTMGLGPVAVSDVPPASIDPLPVVGSARGDGQIPSPQDSSGPPDSAATAVDPGFVAPERRKRSGALWVAMVAGLVVIGAAVGIGAYSRGRPFALAGRAQDPARAATSAPTASSISAATGAAPPATQPAGEHGASSATAPAPAADQPSAATAPSTPGPATGAAAPAVAASAAGPASAASSATTVVPSAAGPEDAEVTVLCEPACELVAIDSHLVSPAKQPYHHRPGAHGIGVGRAHYGGQWKQVTVLAGEPLSVAFTLTPVASPAPAASDGKAAPCGRFLKRCPPD